MVFCVLHAYCVYVCFTYLLTLYMLDVLVFMLCFVVVFIVIMCIVSYIYSCCEFEFVNIWFYFNIIHSWNKLGDSLKLLDDT